MIKTCPVCAKEFESELIQTVYCSPECVKEMQRRRSREYYRAHRPPPVCFMCGKALGEGRRVKYCPECRKEAQRRSKRRCTGCLLPDNRIPRCLDEIADEVEQYNKAHGTSYSYGWYTYLKDSGKLHGAKP